MSRKILVGYVTKTGSTRETAESIAKDLTRLGFEAEAKPLAKAGDLDRYDGVVVGAPVNAMVWHPEAMAFVRGNAAALAARPTAYFLLSLAYGVGRAGMKAAIPGRLAPASALVPPVATACFGGVMQVDPPLILRLLFGIKKGSPRDGRDWGSVKAFAEELSRKMA